MKDTADFNLRTLKLIYLDELAMNYKAAVRAGCLQKARYYMQKLAREMVG